MKDKLIDSIDSDNSDFEIENDDLPLKKIPRITNNIDATIIKYNV